MKKPILTFSSALLALWAIQFLFRFFIPVEPIVLSRAPESNRPSCTKIVLEPERESYLPFTAPFAVLIYEHEVPATDDPALLDSSCPEIPIGIGAAPQWKILPLILNIFIWVSLSFIVTKLITRSWAKPKTTS